MTTCIIRTAAIYILLVLAMRLTGKRQIGELETSELVSTILISEIAAAPVSNQDVPITFAVIPILVIISFEVIISFLVTQSNLMKRIFIGSPSVLVKRGELQPKEMSKARMSLEELLCELRICGFSTLEDVDYAILESNGKLSVAPRSHAKPMSLGNMGIESVNAGIAHAVVIDGTVKEEALKGSGKDHAWLKKELKKAKLPLEDTFLLSVDDADHIYIIKRKDTQ